MITYLCLYHSCISLSIFSHIFVETYYVQGGFPGGSDGKESVCSAGDPGSLPGLGQLTPVFLPGETHGQKSLASHSPWGLKMSNTAE